MRWFIRARVGVRWVKNRAGEQRFRGNLPGSTLGPKTWWRSYWLKYVSDAQLQQGNGASAHQLSVQTVGVEKLVCEELNAVSPQVEVVIFGPPVN
jgi:hypothetical protein